MPRFSKKADLNSQIGSRLDSHLRPQLRRATIGDITAMMQIEQASPPAAHWSPQQYEGLFAASIAELSCERFAWVAEENNKSASNTASERTNRILGFLVAQRVGPEWQIENVVVDRSARRREVGTGLLEELTSSARALKGAAIFLEVRKSNLTARAFYSANGFEEAGSRGSYYSSPIEDAILYRLKLL